MNNLKKQLFETIDYSEKERKEEEKLLLNKKRQ